MQVMYSQAAFADFLSSEASKHFSIDLSNASLCECLEAKIKFKERMSPNYGRSHSTLLMHLKLMESDLNCLIVPSQVGDVFYSFFITRLLDKGLKPSSIETFCYQLRSCLEWSSKHGCRVSDTYSEFSVPKYHRPAVALTPDEVSHVYHYDLSDIERKDHRANLEKVRDMFVLSCQLGQRHSDMVRIQPKNFNRNIFTIIQQKTGRKAVVDIDKYSIDKKTTYEILEKYNYTAPFQCSINRFNILIRELLQIIGFDDEVLLETKIRGEIKEEKFPRYKLIASHTCRRTFISNNVFRGIPEYLIRKASGHADSRSFNKYICNEID